MASDLISVFQTELETARGAFGGGIVLRNSIADSGSMIGLKAELEAALAVLNPQITGVSDIALHPVSHALQRELNAAGVSMTHRRELIEQVLTDIAKLAEDVRHGTIKQILDDINKLLEDMQILKNDGYPTPQTFAIGDVLLGELNNEVAEVQAGAGVFQPPPAMGVKIVVQMSGPVNDLPLPANPQS